MAEIALEKLAFAMESTRFTAVTPPTNLLPLTGTIKPVEEKYKRKGPVGTYEEFGASKTMLRYGEWAGEGEADPDLASWLFQAAVKGGVTPTTPTNGVLTRLWQFVPTAGSDDLKTMTMYWGDPAVRIFQAPGAYVETIEITSNTDGTDPTMWSISGKSATVADVAAPAFPAYVAGELLTPGNIQVWIDSSSAIGTTLVTAGTVVQASHTIVTQINPKAPGGQSGIPTYTRLGRMVRSIETRIVFELLNMTYWDMWEAETSLKVRVRHNGRLIESVTPDYYRYIEVDTYGPFEFGDWTEYVGSNRAMELVIRSEYNSTLGASWRVAAQNTTTAL